MTVVQTSSQEAVANAAGVASASIGPVPIGQTWKIERTSVQSNSAARSTATVYRGVATTPANYIDSAKGSGNGDSSMISYRLRPGESVTVQWTGCTVGARCTFSIDGEVE
jgi:hypothetical protein